MSVDILDNTEIEIKIEENEDMLPTSLTEGVQSYDPNEFQVDVTFPVIDSTGKSDSIQTVTRKRGRPPRHCEYEWSERDTFRLIESWSKEKLLYNTSDVFYMHRDFRMQSLNNICKSLRDTGVELSSPSDVRNKMNNLRNYYAAEKRKEKKSLDSELPFKSNWKFYDELCFLDENYRPRSFNAPDEKASDAEYTEFLLVPSETAPTMILQRSLEADHRLVDNSKQESSGYKRKSDRVSTPPKASPSPPKQLASAPLAKASDTNAKPASSFMTVFRKSRKNSKVMYSMNESANFVVETRPVLENSSKSFRMNRRASFPKPLGDEVNNQNSNGSDDANMGRLTPQQGDAYPKESTIIPTANGLVPRPDTSSTASSNTNAQNLDKCYADLIYQLLVSMPDSVEKAMLKLEFQQKLVKLKYSQAGGEMSPPNI